MGYQDDEFSSDNNPGPRLGVGRCVDPQQLAQRVMAARAAQQVGRGAGTSPANSRGVGVSTGPLVDPQRLAQLLMTIRAAQRGGQGASAAQPSAPPQALPVSVLGPTDPFAAGAGNRMPTPLPNASPDMALAIQKLPRPNPAKAAVIQKLRQALASRGLGDGPQSTTGSAIGQTGADRPQIPLGGAPPPPGVPANAFDQARITELTVEQVAGIVLDENGTGKYKVEPLGGRSTPEDLHRAKTAQALAGINGDLRFGKKRPRTADWQTTEAQRKTPEYQQALEAARAAYQEYKFGIDRTRGRALFGNRFENDVGKNEEFLRKDRIVRDKYKRPVGTEQVFDVHGPFTAGGGKVWTHIFDDMQPIKSTRQAPPKKTGHPAPGGKTARVK